jgi:hypothetical protein
MKLPRAITMPYLAFICLCTLVVSVTAGVAKVQALPPDVGLVTQLSGVVTYRNKGYQETTAKAQSFMKIRRGDRFKLPAGAIIQVVYFLGGRQETWKGPVAFTIGDSESRPEPAKGPRAQPKVVILPAGTTQGVRRIPALLRRAGVWRPGAGQIRGEVEASPTAFAITAEEKAEIAAAKEIYRSLRKQTDPHDITPELYLLGVLTDYEQYGEMEEVLNEALKRQPDNETLKKLKKWVLAQRAQGRSPSTK